MEKYVNKNGTFNHGKWIRENQLSEEEDTNSPSWQLVRALNSLGNDLKDTKHKKMMKWGDTYHRSVPDTIKTIERLHKIVKKMK